jgi:flagellar biosynthesis repressor protein FlbT
MPLKLTLKPHERIVIGKAFVTNAETATKIFIENKVPILRQKDIMSEKEAKTSCEKIYFIIQMMYLDPDSITHYHSSYWTIVRSVITAAPSLLAIIEQISELILAEEYYSALKKTRQLVKREAELISYAKKESI